MPEESYEGLTIDKIPWNPIIDYDKYVACGKCVAFCHVGSFRIEEQDGKKRAAVTPNKCIIFCRGCEDVCPADAITPIGRRNTKSHR